MLLPCATPLPLSPVVRLQPLGHAGVRLCVRQPKLHLHLHPLFPFCSLPLYHLCRPMRCAAVGFLPGACSGGQERRPVGRPPTRER